MRYIHREKNRERRTEREIQRERRVCTYMEFGLAVELEGKSGEEGWGRRYDRRRRLV